MLISRLEDMVELVDGAQREDPTLRPNQVFARISRHPIRRRERWRQVVGVVTDRLLTPVGLRSLAPGHLGDKPTYWGRSPGAGRSLSSGNGQGLSERPLRRRRLMVYHDAASAHALISVSEMHSNETGIGTISEIFDAEPPYRPCGCIHQAWSVAEVLPDYLATAPQEKPVP